MIKGIGTDILQISRIQKALERTPKLAQRILTPLELTAFQADNTPARFLAKRFAAKEAVSKALGTGIGRGVSWQDMSIHKDDYGRPWVELSGGALARAEQMHIAQVQLSYSDEKDYIVAFAIAEAGH